MRRRRSHSSLIERAAQIQNGELPRLEADLPSKKQPHVKKAKE